MSANSLQSLTGGLRTGARRRFSPSKWIGVSLAAALILAGITWGTFRLWDARRRSPAAELARFTLAPGFRAELVASEPLVRDPIALAFDPDGRIWVCEMQGFMPDYTGKGEGAPIGRIVILEDTDGDGRMDKSTVFLDQLVLPRAIALVKDGALVAEPPRLWFARDRDGDGRADEKIEVDPRFSLPSAVNPEHLPNSLLWAMDNRIYTAKSDASYRLAEDGGFLRQRTAFRGQWGITQDDWGRLFYNYNSVGLRADIISDAQYLERNGNFRTTAGLNCRVLKDQRVWPSHLTPGVNSGHSALSQGKLQDFTAACGPVIYRGDLFPPEFRGNAFVCEPAGNLVKRLILSEEDGNLTAKNAYDGKEFLAAADERFRPVNLYTGPDGALWVVDMYRGVIQHKSFLSKTLRKHIRERKLDAPIGMGRIWRIVPENAKPGPLPKLPRASTAELVAQLEHPNGWWRDTAQRLLVERRDPAAVPALLELARSASLAPARLHALWTLDGMDQLDPQTVESALGNVEPKIRAAAIRLSGRFVNDSPTLKGRLLAMIEDRAPEVQFQLMLTLGDLRDDRALQAMVSLFASAASHPYMADATVTGLDGRELEFLAAFLRSSADAHACRQAQPLLDALAEALLSDRDPVHCLRLLEFIAEQPAPWPRASLISALASVEKAARTGFRPIALERAPSGWEGLHAALPSEVASKIADLFSWPGKPSSLEPNIVPLTAPQQELFAKGRELYSQICAACHQPDGLGQDGLAPPLSDSEWVVGSEEQLIRIVLHGVTGQISVDGRSYNMEMPPFGSLNDEQIAAILTYLRREWNHGANPVAPATVGEVRAATIERDRPWTQRALQNPKLVPRG